MSPQSSAQDAKVALNKLLLWGIICRCCGIAFTGALAVRHHLSSLSKTETATYIDFQIKRAGGSEKLFDSAAKELIHDFSGGIPRQINNLATACLLQSLADNATRVNESIVRQTLNEFTLP